MIQCQREGDGFAITALVDIILQLLFLFHAGGGSGRRGRKRAGRGVFPKRNRAVGAAGDEHARGGVHGEGPDAIGVVVERGGDFTGGGVPDLDEAVSARAGDLRGAGTVGFGVVDDGGG